MIAKDPNGGCSFTCNECGNGDIETFHEFCPHCGDEVKFFIWSNTLCEIVLDGVYNRDGEEFYELMGKIQEGDEKSISELRGYYKEEFKEDYEEDKFLSTIKQINRSFND